MGTPEELSKINNFEKLKIKNGYAHKNNIYNNLYLRLCF